MANIIRHKRTTVPGRIPSQGQLASGELAINCADGKVFTKKTDGTVVEISRSQVIDGGEVTYDSLLLGLSAFWTMDEVLGTRKDSSSNAFSLRDATLDTMAVVGASGTAARVSKNNFLYCSEPFQSKRTVSFWVRRSASASSEENLVSFGTDVSGANQSFSVVLDATQHVKWNFSAGSSRTLDGGELGQGVWTHFVVVWDQPAGKYRIYKNATMAAELSSSDSLSSSASDLFVVGPSSSEMLLDCVGIWSRALTNDEISNLYGSGDAYSLAPVATPQIDETAFVNLVIGSAVQSITASVPDTSNVLFPTFSTSIHDYVLRSQTATPGQDVSYRIVVNGTTFTGVAVLGSLIKVTDNTNNYYIRLIPSDLPLGEVSFGPTEDYLPGYYLVGHRRDSTTQNVSAISFSAAESQTYNSAVSTARNDFLITNASYDSLALWWARPNPLIGFVVAAGTYLTGSQTVTGVTRDYITISGVGYTRITLSAPASATSPAALTAGSQNVTVTFTNLPNYNVVYNELGVPLWYQVPPVGQTQLIQPGNEINRLLIGRRGTSGSQYVQQITNNSVLAKPLQILPTTKNGNAYTYQWQQHEIVEISSPPSRRGNIMAVAFVPTPSANTAPGQQAINDKAYGVYLQEQSPSGNVIWDWWSGDHFNAIAAAQNSSFFHLNAFDVHPVTGDILCSFRGCSALICIEYSTKKVKWVIQGVPQALGTLQSAADPVATQDTKYLTLQDEPFFQSVQYQGPAGQHHVKWKTNVDPLSPGNDVISVFDNSTYFFAGNNTARSITSLSRSGSTVSVTTSTAHGLVTGDYAQISGASVSDFNGVFQITFVSTTSFTYSSSGTQGSSGGTRSVVKATNFFPNSMKKARGVVYEIDLANQKAIHRCSILSDGGASGYLGSYTILQHEGGGFSHTMDWNGEHPNIIEYSDGGDGASPGSKTLVMDFPGDLYRVIKVPLSFLDINYLRATTNMALTQQ